ncbi:MAG: ABC transporter permease [Christensenellaceae bacterium]|nr:ABC transporter permease [Christensenellaceae bacterium]
MKSNIGKFLRGNIIVVALVAAVALLTFTTDGFMTASNITHILAQISLYGMVAFAMTISIIGGEFDLSVSSLMGVTTILFTDIAKRAGVPLAILACLFAGALVGALNGFMVSKLKINAFVATLAMMLMLKGFALTYTNGKPINYPNADLNAFGNGEVWGLPNITWFFLGALALSWLTLSRTRFGRNVYATGGNLTVAKMAGINVDFYKAMLFVILGVTTAAAGILMAMRLSSGNSLYGGDLTMSVVAGVVIGGTSLSGGRGGAPRTLWGMLLVGVLFNGLQRLEVQANWQDVVKGLILIAVVSADAVLMQIKRKPTLGKEAIA